MRVMQAISCMALFHVPFLYQNGCFDRRDLGFGLGGRRHGWGFGPDIPLKGKSVVETTLFTNRLSDIFLEDDFPRVGNCDKRGFSLFVSNIN